MRYLYRFCGILLAAVLPAFLCAQNKDEDRFIRLMSAQSVSNVEEHGKTIRKAMGPARFLHNDTWLVCDTALWDVEAKIIYAMGNVSIEQEKTELRSEKLTYYIDRDVAEFRGNLVELVDKDMNILRTNNLDYNTKDSVAVFHWGAAMKDKDGQIIESTDGTYDSKIEEFTFENKVNMFSDSVFVNTSMLIYNSRQSLATFPQAVDAWQQDRMLSGGNGYYNNDTQIFFLKDRVHTMDSEKEGWSDSLYFYRKTNELVLNGNAQLTDTTRNVTGIGDYIYYRDSLKLVKVKKNPLMIVGMEETDSSGVTKIDSVFMRSDYIQYWSVMRFKADSAAVQQSQARMADLGTDPVANIKAKAAEEAAKKRQEAIDNDPNAPFEQKSKEAQEKILKQRGQYQANTSPAEQVPPAEQAPAKENPEPPVTEQAEEGPELPKEVADTTSAMMPIIPEMQADSLAGPVLSAADSVEIGFVKATGNIKVYRKTMQMVCDSLEYTDLDSLARLYKNPVVWNNRTHQYNADSIFVSLRGKRMEKANLLSNAFIHVEESDNRFYDQIKSTEMTAFFDQKGELARFDALGGASAIFYMKEKDEIATANKSEATIMTANFKDGELQSVSYFENPSSAAYPMPQMHKEDQYLKGFQWTPQMRPSGRNDISARTVKNSQRSKYLNHPKAQFKQTGIYFKGYMQGIYRQIEIGDSLRAVNEERQRLHKAQKDSLAKARQELADSSLITLAADSLTVPTIDSLAITGAVGIIAASDSLAHSDSLSIRVVADSLAAGDSLSFAARHKSDSLTVAAPLSEKEIKAQEKARKHAESEAKRKAAQKEREAKIKAAQEKREARWNELDTRDALRKAAKDAKKRAKEEKKLRKQIRRMEKEKAREDALIKRYRDKYLQKNL